MAVTPEILVDAYRQIAEQRMKGLPFLNPALEVEAVGFRTWEGHQVGVLITPWFMNLVLIPGPEAESRDLGGDKATAWEFPGGRCDLHVSRPDGQILHLCASLFTSVEGFPDQGTAREVAREVLRNLFTVPADGRSNADQGEAGADALLARPVSRRAFLRRFTMQDD